MRLTFLRIRTAQSIVQAPRGRYECIYATYQLECNERHKLLVMLREREAKPWVDSQRHRWNNLGMGHTEKHQK